MFDNICDKLNGNKREKRKYWIFEEYFFSGERFHHSKQKLRMIITFMSASTGTSKVRSAWVCSKKADAIEAETNTRNAVSHNGGFPLDKA